MAKKKPQLAKAAKSSKKAAANIALVKKGSAKPPSQLSRQRRDHSGALLADIRELIVEARQQTAQVVNTALTLTYWQIGFRIRTEVLGNKRAGYGEEILQTLSAKLVPEFGRGYSKQSLLHMIRFAESFPKFPIVSALSRQLAWSHFLEVVYLKDDLSREFYIEMCRSAASRGLATEIARRRPQRSGSLIRLRFRPQGRPLTHAAQVDNETHGARTV